MCAGSKAVVGDVKVSLYMGYNGGDISIGDFKYEVEDGVEQEVLAGELNKFTKDELVNLIVDLLNNSEEY